MNELSHLHAIQFRISSERIRLAQARNPREIAHRKVWVEGAERELEAERRFLAVRGISTEESLDAILISDDELTRELLG